MKTHALAAMLAGATAILATVPADAQETQPSVPAVTDQRESLDSGVGDLDAETWVGKPVASSDGREIGRLVRVDMASDTTDGGRLMVQRDKETVGVPLKGASFDGAKVVVTPLFEAIVTD